VLLRLLTILAVLYVGGVQLRAEAAYHGQTEVTYSILSGSLHGYARTWKDPWEWDYDWFCVYLIWDEYYGTYCLQYFYRERYVHAFADTFTPSFALMSTASAWDWDDATANDSVYGSEEGLWTMVGDHYMREDFYDIICNDPYSCWWYYAGPSWYHLGQTADQAEVCFPPKAWIIQEYQFFQAPPVFTLIPACADFTNGRQSLYFSFSELNTGDYAWALLRDPLISSAGSGHGLDLFREAFGGPRIINSAYRNPLRNAAVGGAVGSRHMYGDAADVRNESCPSAQNCPSPTPWVEWDQMVIAGIIADAWIEPASGPCDVNCVHVDWRHVPGDYQ
jgi:hypothetical protein